MGMKTVNQAAKLCGVSVRTLHYYDEIGLLHPAKVTEAGYRMYDDAALERLQQILFFRELDFPLEEIRRILDSPAFDSREALSRHRDLLLLKRKRLDNIIALVEKQLKGDYIMDLQAFDSSEIQKAQEAYAREAQERWGVTPAYQESRAKTKGYDQEGWARVAKEAKEIYQAFLAAMDQGPGSPEALAQAAAWQDYITRNFYTCTPEILAGLGEMYAADPRFQASIDAEGEGLASFMSEAIKIYCKKQGA